MTMALFGRRKKVVVQEHALYPMGAYTFAIACAHCKNREEKLGRTISKECYECKMETKSHFDFDPERLVKR